MNAKEILMKAIQCDQVGRILEAQSYYQEGIKILTELVSNDWDADKKIVFDERIKEYVGRTEQIDKRVRRLVSQGELVAHIPLRDGATGYSYKTLFGEYITSEIKEVLQYEPWLISRNQFKNLISFYELLVKNSNNLKFISLTTKPDPKDSAKQLSILQQIKDDLANRDITLSVKFENTLHDRKIVLSNGYIIKSGRGLDIFKADKSLFYLGLTDYEFRRCFQTDVDIWRTKYIS